MQVFMVALLVFCIILWLSSRFKKKCYKNFRAEVHFDEVRMVQDEEFYYELELQNKKFMILPIIKISLRVPSSFDIANKKSLHYTDTPYSYTVTTSLFWYQKLKRKIRIVPHVRGFYDIETTITCMDLFGLSKMKYPKVIKSRIMIHPKTIFVPYQAHSRKGLQGNDVVQRWIHKDPLLYSGFREYTFQDNIRDIDWKMSAKQNQILVKTYDATSDPSIVFMYLGYKDENYHSHIVEYNVSYFACLLRETMENHIPVSFNTNFVLKGKMKGSTGLECNGNHLIHMLDMLACISYATGLDPKTYLMRNLPLWGSSHMFVLIMRKVEDDVASVLQLFARRGYQMQLFVHEPISHYIPNVEVHILQGGQDNE